VLSFSTSHKCRHVQPLTSRVCQFHLHFFRYEVNCETLTFPPSRTKMNMNGAPYSQVPSFSTSHKCRHLNLSQVPSFSSSHKCRHFHPLTSAVILNLSQVPSISTSHKCRHSHSLTSDVILNLSQMPSFLIPHRCL
jgi:hypothetical protein